MFVLLQHGPGHEVFSIRDECLQLQSNVTNKENVSGLGKGTIV